MKVISSVVGLAASAALAMPGLAVAITLPEPYDSPSIARQPGDGADTTPTHTDRWLMTTGPGSDSETFRDAGSGRSATPTSFAAASLSPAAQIDSAAQVAAATAPDGITATRNSGPGAFAMALAALGVLATLVHRRKLG